MPLRSFGIAVWRYLADAWWAYQSEVLSRVVQWKSFGLASVLTLVGIFALSDFGFVNEGEERGEWGLKAAFTALGAGMLLVFILLPGSMSPNLERTLRLFSALCACLSGVFWLLSTTGGNLVLFLSVIVPFVLFGLLVLAFGMLGGAAGALGPAFRSRRALRRQVSRPQSANNEDVNQSVDDSKKEPPTSSPPLG